MASYLATVALGPTSCMSRLHVRGMSPIRFDSIDSQKGRMVGADLMAGTVLYACFFAHNIWFAAAFAAFDLAYYGPMGLSMPTAAAVGVLTML